jgi:predicted ArsR family transcriptional regulator
MTNQRVGPTDKSGEHVDLRGRLWAHDPAESNRSPVSEPRREAAIITLANCPFDALARDHTELVCGMNLVLVGAVADQVGDGALAARLGRPTTAAASCWVPADRAD